MKKVVASFPLLFFGAALRCWQLAKTVGWLADGLSAQAAPAEPKNFGT